MTETDDPPALEAGRAGGETGRNARRGLLLFALYLGFYGAFVLVSAFRPSWMESSPLAGINLAVLWGLGLIVSAFVLAVAYAWICGRGSDSR